MVTRFLSWAAAGAAFFGIVGAAIVLLSWMVTNTISSRLASAKAALDRVSAAHELHQRLAVIRRGYREARATLSRVDLLLSELNPKSVFSTFPESMTETNRTTYALLQSAESSFFEHEDLQEVVSEARGLAVAGGLPRALDQELRAATEEAEALLREYAKITAVWDRQRRDAIELVKAGQTDPGLFQRATSNFVAEAVPLHERFFARREALIELQARALTALATRHNRFKVAHSVSERLSWFLYVVGTAIAILGKALESRAT